MSGGALTSCSDERNPCRTAYIDYCGHGVNRPSWDPLTLVAAVRGAEGVRSVGSHGVREVTRTCTIVPPTITYLDPTAYITY